MASKYAQPDPEPVKHPAFVPVELHPKMAQAYILRLVTETLRQAWELTPWNQAVVIVVQRERFNDMADAVALVAGPVQSMRVWVRSVGRLQGDKKVWIDPHHGKIFKGTPPWGPEPTAVAASE